MDSSEPPSTQLYFLVLAILLLLSMFFSASESSFLSASRLRLRYLSEKKNKAAIRTENLTRKKDRFLTAILIGNNIVNIATSALITAVSIDLFGNSGVGIATAISTLVILIFGEILPKSIAITRPESIALKLSLPLSVCIVLLTPLILLFSGITGLITRLLGIRTAKGPRAVTEEDIKTLIEISEEEGLIESKEREMLSNIMKYSDLTARDLMTPRTDIVAVSESSSIAELLELSRSTSFSRFPVYGEDIDDIRGIMYIKDFLYATEHNPNTNIRSLIRPVFYCFEGQTISSLQAKFHEKKQNLAIVLDEYGGTAGLVTTEDLLEKIFGDLQDEYDKPAEIHAITAPHPEQQSIPATVPGWIRLDEISEKLGISLQSDFYDTLGGYLLERFGDIPAPGSQIIEQGFVLTVEAVVGNRIETIRIQPEGGTA